MMRFCSLFIARGCWGLLILVPLGMLYLLVDVELFASVAKGSLNLPIQWPTVTAGQWYALWGLTLLYLLVGLIGLFYLARAFSHFAKGELFTLSNSRDLRRFAICMFAQALAKPLHFALSSLLLSMNHPAGEKILSISLGNGEVKVVALAMILWVMSELLVKACNLEQENNQFV